MQRGQQSPLLVAGGASAALLAGKGDEHLVLAVGAANACKAFLQIAALEKGGQGNKRPVPFARLEKHRVLARLIVELISLARWGVRQVYRR